MSYGEQENLELIVMLIVFIVVLIGLLIVIGGSNSSGLAAEPDCIICWPDVKIRFKLN